MFFNNSEGFYMKITSFVIGLGIMSTWLSILWLLGTGPFGLTMFVAFILFLHGVLEWKTWIKGAGFGFSFIDGLAVGVVIEVFTHSFLKAVGYGILTFIVGTIAMFAGAYIGRRIDYH
jgi:hypothetical protein